MEGLAYQVEGFALGAIKRDGPCKNAGPLSSAYCSTPNLVSHLPHSWLQPSLSQHRSTEMLLNVSDHIPPPLRPQWPPQLSSHFAVARPQLPTPQPYLVPLRLWAHWAPHGPSSCWQTSAPGPLYLLFPLPGLP